MVCRRRGSSGSDPPRLDGGIERGGEGGRVRNQHKQDRKRLEIKANVELNGIDFYFPVPLAS